MTSPSWCGGQCGGAAQVVRSGGSGGWLRPESVVDEQARLAGRVEQSPCLVAIL